MLYHVTLCGLVWECGRRLWIREYTEQGFRPPAWGLRSRSLPMGMRGQTKTQRCSQENWPGERMLVVKVARGLGTPCRPCSCAPTPGSGVRVNRIFLFNPLWVMPSPVGRCLFLSV